MITKIRASGKKFFDAVTLLSGEIIILSLLFSIAFLAFIFITRVILKENKSDFDVAVFNYFSGYISNNNTRIMRWFTFLGSHKFLIPANILLLTWFLFLRKSRWHSISIPVVALSSLLLMISLKYFFHRNRPVTPLLHGVTGYSFPSGHALMSFTFYGLLIYLAWHHVKNKWLKWTLIFALALLIFTIGLSRVYLRVHYATDVIAGFCVGCMWLLLSLGILKRVEEISNRKIEETKGNI